MSFHFGQTSKRRFKGVHPDLVKVVIRALEISSVDFGVTDGLRRSSVHISYLKTGKSWTVNSKHLKCHCCGNSHAIDLYAWVAGSISWLEEYYIIIKNSMFEAAKELKIKIKWGGDWVKKDLVHFQLA